MVTMLNYLQYLKTLAFGLKSRGEKNNNAHSPTPNTRGHLKITQIKFFSLVVFRVLCALHFQFCSKDRPSKFAPLDIQTDLNETKRPET